MVPLDVVDNPAVRLIPQQNEHTQVFARYRPLSQFRSDPDTTGGSIARLRKCNDQFAGENGKNREYKYAFQNTGFGESI
jgi:hypothetical protein